MLYVLYFAEWFMVQSNNALYFIPSHCVLRLTSDFIKQTITTRPES
jgi:hypothetical protein